MACAGVAAYATASALIDIPSGRLPGVFIVDNSGGDGSPPYSPSCVAFEPDPKVSPLAAPLVVIMTIARHYNDRTLASIMIHTNSTPSAVVGRNGLGSPLPLTLTGSGAGSITFNLSVGALPQYITLPADASAAVACSTLQWEQ